MPATKPHLAFTEALNDLSALGISEDVRHGSPFGLIRARSNARWWIVPLESSRHAASGLDLFQPASASAKVIKAAARISCQLGLQRQVFRKKLHLSGAEELAASFPTGASTCAIFTGTDGPHRKTTLQFIGKNGAIIGYGKLSRSATIIPWLENEAHFLDTIASTQLTSVETPRVKEFRKQSGVVLLLTDSKKNAGFGTPLKLGNAHAEFLNELASKMSGGDWKSYIGNLRHRFEEVKTVLGEIWRQRLLKLLDLLATGPDLPLTLAHGDFTPWNSFQGEKLYVFDWEYAGKRARGYDAAHFTFATMPLAEPDAIWQAATSAITNIHRELSPLDTQQALLAYLCDHTLFYAHRETAGLHRIDNWDGAERMAKTIDLGLEIAMPVSVKNATKPSYFGVIC